MNTGVHPAQRRRRRLHDRGLPGECVGVLGDNHGLGAGGRSWLERIELQFFEEIEPEIDQFRPSRGSRRGKIWHNQQVAGARARHVPHALVFERLSPRLFFAGKRKRRGGNAPYDPMQRVVGMPMHKSLRRSCLCPHVDRDHNGPFETFRAVNGHDFDRVS